MKGTLGQLNEKPGRNISRGHPNSTAVLAGGPYQGAEGKLQKCTCWGATSIILGRSLFLQYCTIHGLSLNNYAVAALTLDS
jgi:hypothetical protein